MSEIKTDIQLEMMQKAGHMAARCHREVASRLAPGVTTQEIDLFVERWLQKNGATAEQKGYSGYPYAICASINDVVCHGFPDARELNSGDIVTIDFVVNYKGWLADMAWTYPIGHVRPEVKRLVQHTLYALRQAVKLVKPGTSIGDISSTIGQIARTHGYGIVTALVGHGIGQDMHEPPEVPNDGWPGTGPVLETGMIITLEPIFTLGVPGDVMLGHDGWSVLTCDGTWGAHFEHTVAVTDSGPRVLTMLPFTPGGKHKNS